MNTPTKSDLSGIFETAWVVSVRTFENRSNLYNRPAYGTCHKGRGQWIMLARNNGDGMSALRGCLPSTMATRPTAYV